MLKQIQKNFVFVCQKALHLKCLIRTTISVNENVDSMELPNDDNRWQHQSSHVLNIMDPLLRPKSNGYDHVPIKWSNQNWLIAICWDLY